MGDARLQSIWALARRQHGVISYAQLRELGFSSSAIKHRRAAGRLHAVHLGVFAVGVPWLSRGGIWMAAVLRCGPGAVLSDLSAAALWGLLADGLPDLAHDGANGAKTEVTIPPGAPRVAAGIRVHRRMLLEGDFGEREGIPATSPERTLIDVALRLNGARLEAATNAADRQRLTTQETLRRAVESHRGSRGVGLLREMLDRHSFRLTDSELERRFLRILREAGLPLPRTGEQLSGFRVDFHWPELGLVVETDGLTYHRTAAQQGRDRLRDQTLTAAGITCLRFTHAQVARQPAYVAATVARVVRLLLSDGSRTPQRP